MAGWRVWWCAGILLAVNLLISARLFRVEYSAYNSSNEGTFIAISRVMAEHPLDWNWWQLWDGGLPIENTYSPLVPAMSASVARLTGVSPARAFHLVGAAFFAAGPLTLFWMAWVFSRKLATSFVASLAYSCLSLSAILIPAIRVDTQGALNLRRLQVLAFYGEAPHTIALTLLPVAFLCFAFALTKPGMKWKILAGLSIAAVALTNAFGIVALAFGFMAWLVTLGSARLARGILLTAAIGALTYAWISPWMPPSVLLAIRANSPTVDGDFRYTTASWIALCACVAGYGVVWLVLKWLRVDRFQRFFAMLAYAPVAILTCWYGWRVAVVVQPTRYHLQMDLFLLLALVFLAGSLVDRLPRNAQVALVGVVIAALGAQVFRSVRFARGQVRRIDPVQLVEYKIEKWMDENRHGQRAFISGSSSFLYNVFTDNPQLHGGHDPMQPNPFIRAVVYTIYSGANAGDRDAEFSTFWLKAFGANAVSVSFEKGREYYKPFTHPHKFEGVLKEIWRDGDDVIYEIPARSRSLAHVIPRSAVPTRTPIHGLDIEPVKAYVEALDDPRMPLAAFEWQGSSAARIEADVGAGQLLAVQVSYSAGWEATANGRPTAVTRDAIGQMVIEGCAGPCEVSLKYTGGAERVWTRAASLGSMLVVALLVAVRRRRLAGDRS